jgi:hypothetical protein
MLPKAANKWEEALAATSGAIVPDKTSWFIMDFAWQEGFWQ